RHALCAALAFLAAALALAADTVIYRIELAGSQAIWSKDRPQQAGNLLLFHRHPGGTLMRVKKNDVRRVVATPVVSQAPTPPARQRIGACPRRAADDEARKRRAAQGPGAEEPPIGLF